MMEKIHCQFFLVLLISPLSVAETALMKQFFHVDTRYTDLLPSDELLWTQNGSFSLSRCAIMCAAESVCLSIFFNNDSCHGYPYRMDNLRKRRSARVLGMFYAEPKDRELSLLDSNIPAFPTYGVYMSQFIRYSGTCSKYRNFVIMLSAEEHTYGTGIRNVQGMLGNFALLKPTIQGSYRPAKDGNSTSEYAVDGQRWPGTRNPLCSISNSADTAPFWQVDLQQAYVVHAVAILIINANPISSIQIEIANVLGAKVECISNPGPSSIERTFRELPCNAPTLGQYVRISKTEKYLTLCEVEVYGTYP